MSTSHEPNGERDVLPELRSAGFEVDLLDETQLAVLRELSAEEVTVLIDIRRRLVETGPEVEAHTMAPMTIGGLFF